VKKAATPPKVISRGTGGYQPPMPDGGSLEGVAVRRLVRLINVPITAAPEILNILFCQLRSTLLPRASVNKGKRTSC
jgi:hypothetical protein